MSRPPDRPVRAGRMRPWTPSLLAASLVLLAVSCLSTRAGAAPLDDENRVVPTPIHDRAQAEGEVRVLVELSLPSRRQAEGGLSGQARADYRKEISDTAARVLSRLTKHPHRVLR